MTESEERARRMFDSMSITDRSFKEFWASVSSEELKLFWVRNTTGVDRFFLAENAELALYVALSNGDLRNIRNGSSRLVSETYLNKHRAFASAVAKAVRAGRPGPVYRQEDDSVRVNEAVYAPLHAI